MKAFAIVFFLIWAGLRAGALLSGELTNGENSKLVIDSPSAELKISLDTALPQSDLLSDHRPKPNPQNFHRYPLKSASVMNIEKPSAETRKLNQDMSPELKAAIDKIAPGKPIIIITNSEPHPASGSTVMADPAQLSVLQHPYSVVPASQIQTNNVGNNVSGGSAIVSSNGDGTVAIQTNQGSGSQPTPIDEYGSIAYTPGMALPENVRIVDYEKDSSTFLQNGSTNSYQQKTPVEKVTFQDIDTMITVANNVFGMYDQYVKLFPSAETTEEVSAWKKAEAALRFYVKVRSLIMTFVQKRSNLIAEVNYLNGKVDKLQSSEEDMMMFYALDHQYFRTKLNTMMYTEKSKKIQSYWKDFDTYKAEFQVQLQRVIQSTFDIVHFAQMFEDDIREIARNDHDNPMIETLDKLDDTMMMLAKLVERKAELQKSVSVFKDGLISIRLLRQKIIETLASLNQEAQLLRLETLATETKSAPISIGIREITLLIVSAALFA